MLLGKKGWHCTERTLRWASTDSLSETAMHTPVRVSTSPPVSPTSDRAWSTTGGWGGEKSPNSYLYFFECFEKSVIAMTTQLEIPILFVSCYKNIPLWELSSEDKEDVNTLHLCVCFKAIIRVFTLQKAHKIWHMSQQLDKTWVLSLLDFPIFSL